MMKHRLYLPALAGAAVFGLAASVNARKRRKSSGAKEDLERARAAWAGIMAKYNNDLGIVDFIQVLGDFPMLGDEHVENCRMLSSREKLILEMKKGGHVAEVGVQKGTFSQFILENNFPAKLHLFDLNFGAFKVAERFSEQIKAGQVVLHEGYSSIELARLPDRYFDFVYIDGDHSYEGVQRDIAAAKTRIKEDGYLVFNDYTFWSPSECIPYGVVQAVNELCLKEGWKLKYFALGWGMYCDVAVQKSRSKVGQSGEGRTTNYRGLDLAYDKETPHLGGSIKIGDSFTYCPRVWDYMIDRFAIESVLDLGSGCGRASHYFFRKGLKVVAVEGFTPSVLTSNYPAIHHDLTQGTVSTSVDWVHCQEVVEHIEEQYVENVVDSLLTGKVILLTHALPGQAGYHHVNLQPPEYWIQKLEAKGGRQDDTDRVRRIAAADGAIFMQNTGLAFANSL